MCLGCWKSEGKPYDATERARQWAPAFEAANPFGALHIVVGDWNLDDANLAFCRTLKDEITPDEIALLDALDAMSYEERWATAILGTYPNFDPTVPLE